MNILIISQYFYPENFKINDIATELVKRGNDVSVVTGIPNYPEGKIYEGYKNKLFENYNGVKIYRTRIRPRYTGSINLFLNYMSFMFKAKKTIKKIKSNFDMVFCYEPSPIFQLTPSIYAKKLFNCPLVLMCCDQWPESLKARGINRGLIFNLVSKYCRKNMNKCDHILNVSPSFIEYNHAINGVPYEKMSWAIQPCDDFGLQEKINSANETNLIFAGNIGHVQNVEDIVLAYSSLKYENLFIHIFGDGSKKTFCEQLVKREGVEKNVLFYGRISATQLKKEFKKMDACLLTLSGKSDIGNTIPSKLTSYLSTGKPIIAAIKGDSEAIITNNKLGLCCIPDDFNELAKIISNFYNNKEKYFLYGKNARDFFDQNCTLDYFVNNLLIIFKNELKR